MYVTTFKMMPESCLLYLFSTFHLALHVPKNYKYIHFFDQEGGVVVPIYTSSISLNETELCLEIWEDIGILNQNIMKNILYRKKFIVL